MNYFKRFSVIAVGIFVICQQPTILAADDDCDYRVVKVQDGDTLVVRFGPALKYKAVGTIPYDGTQIKMMGPDIQIGKSRWVPIKYEMVEGWVNRGYLEKDCQLLHTATTRAVYHTVVSGDTLYGISKRYGYTIDQITSWNNLQASDTLLVGQRLRVSPWDTCSYRIVKVKNDDMLWIRSEPRADSDQLGAIPYDGVDIQITGNVKKVKKTRWVPIKYRGIEGWVNRAFLERDC
jgi:uncharacterized protein YraI